MSNTKTVEIKIGLNEKMILVFNKESNIWVCKITEDAMKSIEHYCGDNIKVE